MLIHRRQLKGPEHDIGTQFTEVTHASEHELHLLCGVTKWRSADTNKAQPTSERLCEFPTFQTLMLSHYLDY